MKSILRAAATIVIFFAAFPAHAQSSWSAQDYDLYPGDFNGDGLTDMLYIAKDPSHRSGIVLSDGAGLNTPYQSWSDGYLGIPWSGGNYGAIVADFNGDGKADIFLQRNTPGGHYLLLTDDTGVAAISQVVTSGAAGIAWSADQHTLVAGDFNGDGKADLFFQPTDSKGLSAVILADANGQFTAKQPDQSWNDGYVGFNWATTESMIYAGDFNGDGLSDLLVQALPTTGTGPGTSAPAQFAPNSNGVTIVQASKQIFALEGVQAWSQGGFSANWSPLASSVVVGNFNADRRSDVLLQGVTPGNASYLLFGNTPGAIFTSASALSGDALPAAESFLPLVGRFTSDKGMGLYFQSASAQQPNFMATVAGSTVSIKQADASFPAPPAAPAAPASAAPAGGVAAPATLTVTSTGRTPGQFSVSSTGAANYQIPIWVPPGPRGIQPSLAIVYSSQSGDGTMGPGWNLAGLSSIARCNKTYAQDTTPASVALVTTDGYCLNGNRLRLTSGTYGTAGSTYQTEVADFSLITASGTAGNGPAAFIVKGKDGLTYEYGNTSDSRITPSGTITTPYLWLLNKVSDRAGNNYIVTYGTGATGSVGIGVPSSISYTPRTFGSSTYNYTVAFSYGTRISQVPTTNDPAVVGYVNGTLVTNTNLLLSISVTSSSSGSAVLVRQYTLSYGAAPTTTRARLTSVQECAGSAGTNCLSPTLITYQDGSAGVSTTPTTAASSANFIAARDFNGDGREDIAYADTGTSALKVVMASGAGFGSPITVASTSSLVAVGDTLAKGQTDFIVPVSGVYWRYGWNGSSFVGATTGVSVPAHTIGTALMDINGDGLPDLVMIAQNVVNVIKAGQITQSTYTTTVYTQLNTSSGGTFSFSATQNTAFTGSKMCNDTLGNMPCSASVLTGAEPSSGVRTLDFNGDGRKDLAYSTYDSASGYFVKYLTSNGTTFAGSTGYGDDVPVVGFANWNNDVCTDIVMQSYVAVTPCDGQPAGLVGWGGGLVAKATMDWDGDGRTDVLVQNGSNIGVYESTGTGFSSLISTTLPVYTIPATMDQNGDALQEFVGGGPGAIVVHAHNGAGTPPDLVASITDGYGVAYSPAYTSIAQGSYTKGSGASYPDQDYIGPVFVTNQVQITDGISASGTYSQTYSYTNARQNVQGRGFEGYQTRKIVDSRTNAPVRMTYYLDGQNASSRFPLTGMVYQDDVLQSNGTTVISSNVITNTFTALDPATNNQRYFPYTSGTSLTQNEVGGTKNGLIITQAVTNYTFDSYGNATTVASTVTDKDAGSPYVNQIWGSTTTRTIAPNTANWCLGLPTQVQVVNSAPSVPNLTRTVGYTPDYVNCRETVQTVEPSSPTYKVTETFGFDSFGNINSDAIAGIGMTARTTTTAWTDATHTTGQFPITITNALSQATVRGYDYDKGVPTSETDPNGIQTSWGYDDFTRRILETRPDSTTTVTTYNACSSVSGGCQNGDPASAVTAINKMVVIATQKDSSGAAIRDDWTYLDQFDRTIVTKSKTLSGGYSRVGTQFDARGNVYRVTAPCDAASCTVYWTTNSYDALNRLSQQQRPISASNSTPQTTTFAYLGRTTTVTDPQSKVVTRITKVTGTMGRSQDHNGYYQNFGHDAFGSLLSVTDSLSNALFSATYDYGMAAFQRTTTDMDLGARSYNYNALGEITSYSDAKGQNFSFGAFDALGRPTSRTEPDLVTTWTWGSSAASHNIGRLASVVTTGGTTYSESYTFDSLGRLANDTKQGKPFDFAYNTQGTLDTLTYPTTTNSCRVKLQYGYQNGYLKTITDASAVGPCALTGTVYWTANATNPRGEVTQETLGSGVVTNRSFDAVTGWLASIQAGVGGGTGLQNQSYLYDLVGNVTQRQNNALGLTESFCYDNVYRLDHSTLTGVCTGATNLQMTYDATGNITARSDVAAGAAWTYSATHKHQALHAGDASHTYTYDANGNAISRNGQTIGWTSYNLPNLINATGESSTFTYGPRHEKWTQVYTGPSGTETTTYYGKLLETVVTSAGTDWRHYIYAGSEQVAIYSRTSGGTNTLRYTLEDHLGSPSAITSSTGTLLVSENFAAYGTQRNPTTWSGAPPPGDLSTIAGITRQGYTGQTMLGNMGLIHMNGRVMDAITGRFLSADPYISEPGNTQNFNRYGYVYNNPLSNVDPSGLKAKYVPIPTTFTGSMIPGVSSGLLFCIGCDFSGPSSNSGAASQGGSGSTGSPGADKSGGGTSSSSASSGSLPATLSKTTEALEEVIVSAVRYLQFAGSETIGGFRQALGQFQNQGILLGRLADKCLHSGPCAAISAMTTVVDEEGLLAAGAEALEPTAVGAAEGVVTVTHFTSAEGVVAIEGAGALRAGSFVALPSEVSGMSVLQVETALEIQAGRGAFSVTFQTPASNLLTPFNGSVTSGLRTQFQLFEPVPIGPGSFISTP
jgi:RHS repeat-associated protein